MQELSLVARAPVIHQSIDSFHERLFQTETENYTITDGIGFDTCQFRMTGPVEYLVDWYVRGLTRDITWTAPDSSTAWEGWISRLQLTVGGSNLSHSVDGMKNRVLFVYTPLDTTADPPTAEEQTTLTKNDTTSQAQYGIKAGMKSGGECTAATADDSALAQLERWKYITQTETGTPGQGKKNQLTVECLGYAHMLNWYFYQELVQTGASNASSIIADVLGDDPNSVLSADTRNIDTNTLQIEEYQDGKQLGLKVIQGITEHGSETGSEGFPWHFGIYEGRRATYKLAEGLNNNEIEWSTNKYQMLNRQMYDEGDSILDNAGMEIQPWAVRPDHLMRTSGLPGRPTYIQQVRFTAPYRVITTGTDRIWPAMMRTGCG